MAYLVPCWQLIKVKLISPIYVADLGLLSMLLESMIESSLVFKAKLYLYINKQRC